MIKWLFIVIVGWPWCAHRWVIQEEIRAYANGDAASMPSARVYVLRCEKCGDIKKRVVAV